MKTSHYAHDVMGPSTKRFIRHTFDIHSFFFFFFYSYSSSSVSGGRGVPLGLLNLFKLLVSDSTKDKYKGKERNIPSKMTQSTARITLLELSTSQLLLLLGLELELAALIFGSRVGSRC